METVVVVHGDREVRDEYADWLRARGFDVALCGGPEPPDYFCPVLKHCGCVECERGDAMIYDPRLVSQESHPASERIIYRLREWYPQKPVILVNRGGLPADLARLAAEDGGITVVAEPDATTLPEAVRSALDARAAS